MRSLYRRLLWLYPQRVREEFADEMLDVFESASADASAKGAFSYARFCFREAGGLLANAVVAEGRVMKHWKPVLNGGLAGLLVGVAVAAAWAGRPYTSTAVLRVNPAQIPERFVAAQRGMEISRVIPHLLQTVMARGNLTNIINTYGLYRTERDSMPMEDVIDAMRNAIDVAPSDADTVRVSFSYSDPSAAQAVTKDLVNRLIIQYIRERSSQAVLTTQFMKDSKQKAAVVWEESLAALATAESSGKSVARARLDAEVARQRYEAMSAKLADAELTEQMERRQQGQSMELLDPPTLPSEWRPPLLASAAGGVAAGMALGWLVGALLSVRATRAVAEVR